MMNVRVMMLCLNHHSCQEGHTTGLRDAQKLHAFTVDKSAGLDGAGGVQ
jgi:hypothetical protein